ncbi:D-alanyl-D-alanine carboxypeptidase family protein [Paenibacillus sp. sgz500958]|uniref:M15 family metallopeptidase n=1 Tax=Paenibacillus sp. sgz500958 TaxID=3242475 RepID=UPI0036D2315D
MKKKWGFVLFMLVLLGYAVMLTTSYFQEKMEGSEAELSQDLQADATHTLKIVPEDQVHQGNLLLVNKEYPVHAKSVQSDVLNLAEHAELIQGYGLPDQHIRLSRHVAEEFRKMVDAAGQSGVNHFMISSGYRNFEEQDQLYEDKGSDYALPAGYSEHNLGLSLDIGSTEMAMSKASEGKWLERNAWKYGFILRYPKDKTGITGIQYEAWHFRYVGLPHSAIMQEKDLVLEEYIDYLKENKNISVKVEGVSYNVKYYPVSRSAIIQVPEQGRYEISGDNVGGVIVTIA